MPIPRLLLILIATFFAFGDAQAKIEKVPPPNHNNRRALVIGNDDYKNLPKQQRAINDARAVGEAMTRIGFDVTVATNLSREGTFAAVKAFAETLYSGDTAFVFYAGQAFAAGGAEYLVPVDASGAMDVDAVADASLAFDEVIASVMQASPARLVLVVDGCRDNPFRTSPRSRLTSGLATGATENVFVIFSTSIGQTAFESLAGNDTDPNSLFTREFVKIVGRPGQNLIELAKELRKNVSALATSAGQRQIPAYFDALSDHYALLPAK